MLWLKCQVGQVSRKSRTSVSRANGDFSHALSGFVCRLHPNFFFSTGHFRLKRCQITTVAQQCLSDLLGFSQFWTPGAHRRMNLASCRHMRVPALACPGPTGGGRCSQSPASVVRWAHLTWRITPVKHWPGCEPGGHPWRTSRGGRAPLRRLQKALTSPRSSARHRLRA